MQAEEAKGRGALKAERPHPGRLLWPLTGFGVWGLRAGVAG